MNTHAASRAHLSNDRPASSSSLSFGRCLAPCVTQSYTRTRERTRPGRAGISIRIEGKAMADLHVADSASQPPGRALRLPEETCMHPFAYDHPARSEEHTSELQSRENI